MKRGRKRLAPATKARRPRPMLRQQLRWWRTVYTAPRRADRRAERDHAGAKGRSR